MPHNRFYLDSKFNLGAQIELHGDEAHHLQVMRPQKGEIVQIVNGRAELALASFESFQNKGATLAIQTIEIHPPPSFNIILCLAITKGARLEAVLEKGTELGATVFWLFPGQRSDKKDLTETQIQRYKNITVSAMKQCGRLDLPLIEVKPPLLKWKKEDFSYPAFFGKQNSMPFTKVHFQEINGVLFFTGPESGFTQEEENHLNCLGARAVSLHVNTLRADTAPLAALMLLNNL